MEELYKLYKIYMCVHIYNKNNLINYRINKINLNLLRESNPIMDNMKDHIIGVFLIRIIIIIRKYGVCSELCRYKSSCNVNSNKRIYI